MFIHPQCAPSAQRESVRLRDYSAAVMEAPCSRPTTPSTPSSEPSKDREVGQLLEDIRRLQATVDALRESSAKQVAQLERLVKEKSRTIQQLEEQLERQKDYEDLKNQLHKLHNGTAVTQQQQQQQQQDNSSSTNVKSERDLAESPRSNDGLVSDDKAEENGGYWVLLEMLVLDLIWI